MSEAALDIPAADYHAGTDDTPRLSASIAHILWARSPLHAWTAHPRLNPAYERKEEERFDIGKVVHSMLLEGDDVVYVCAYDSWRTNEAKEAREYARSVGKVPLLARDADEVRAAVAAVTEKLAALPDPLFVDGKPEVSLHWSDDGVDFKARLDWLAADSSRVVDLKTTSRSARPDAFARRLFDFGADIQAATYVRAVEAVSGVRPDFLWCVVETSPPYEIGFVRPGSDVLEAGARKLAWAVECWRECMESGQWPGYDREVVEAELPPWEESRLLEREAA